MCVCVCVCVWREREIETEREREREGGGGESERVNENQYQFNNEYSWMWFTKYAAFVSESTVTWSKVCEHCFDSIHVHLNRATHRLMCIQQHGTSTYTALGMLQSSAGRAFVLWVHYTFFSHEKVGSRSSRKASCNTCATQLLEECLHNFAWTIFSHWCRSFNMCMTELNETWFDITYKRTRHWPTTMRIRRWGWGLLGDGDMAQWLEHQSSNPKTLGSIP